MINKHKRFLVALVFAAGLFCTARADLSRQINGIVNRSKQKKVQFGICVVKADSSKIVYKHNSEKAMMPASNMKLIVTAAALRSLGPHFQYETKIGLCNNTLVAIGSGDPLLGDNVTDKKYGRQGGWILDEIITALKQHDVNSIEDIVVDSTVFDNQRVHPNWPAAELNRWYACEVSGLNYNRNCVDITCRNVNGKVNISIEPATNFLKFTNKVRAVSKGKGAVGAYRVPGEINEIIIRGKCKNKQGPFDLAIERPPVFFGFLLNEHLGKAGISTGGQLLEKAMDDDCNFRQLVQFTTSIEDCLARCNKDSFGLAAEALLKTIGNGSWSAGRGEIHTYLQQLGIKDEQFYIDDGSGLSRQNKLTPNAIVQVLLSVYKSEHWKLYRDSLAVGGCDGTIARYFKENKYKEKVLGKTGYISGVKSMSGVCITSEGDYLFSVLANKANGLTREAINDVAKAIIDSADK